MAVDLDVDCGHESDGLGRILNRAQGRETLVSRLVRG